MMQKTAAKNKSTPLGYRILVISIFLCSFGAAPASAGFVLRNDKVQPVTGGTVLGNAELSSVVFRHQEEVQLLKQELAKTRQELRDVQQELNEFRSEFAQFKNLYFRRF